MDRAQEFSIKTALITADRGFEPVDISKRIAELTFFEHLEKPYVTGKIVILDDASVINKMQFFGTERLTLEIDAGEIPDLSFKKTFLMSNLIKTGKVSERVEVHAFSLIDEHAFVDANKKISKSYTGKIEDIVNRILISELNVDVDASYSVESVQEEIKTIIPYMSPIEACRWLLNRATSENGSPYFMWSSLYDQEGEVPDTKNRIRIGNLDNMLKQPAFNENLPYLYSVAATQEVADLSLAEQAVLVTDIATEDMQDTNRMVDEGAIGASFSSYDTYTSQKFERHFRVRDLLNKLKSVDVIPQKTVQNVFDEEQLVYDGNERTFTDDRDARIINTVTSYGTYGPFNSYHDVFDQSQALNKIRNMSLRSLLTKNMIDIEIPGITFFAALEGGGRGVSSGDIVRINFLNTDVNFEKIPEEPYDKEKSGYYMIYAVRNTYIDTRHKIVLTITKLNYDPGA
jgi:hypothetical protein